MREDLVEVRRLIRTRHERRLRVQRAFAEWLVYSETTQGSHQLGVLRCDVQVNGRDCGRKLAEVWKTRDGQVLFASRIDWVPSDQLTLRPWTRDAFLGGNLDPATYDACMSDDHFLTGYLDMLNQWSKGYEASSQRWLKKMDRGGVRELVVDPPEAGQLELWTRCKSHPSAAESNDPGRIVRGLRG